MPLPSSCLSLSSSWIPDQHQSTNPIVVINIVVPLYPSQNFVLASPFIVLLSVLLRLQGSHLQDGLLPSQADIKVGSVNQHLRFVVSSSLSSPLSCSRHHHQRNHRDRHFHHLCINILVDIVPFSLNLTIIVTQHYYHALYIYIINHPLSWPHHWSPSFSTFSSALFTSSFTYNASTSF